MNAPRVMLIDDEVDIRKRLENLLSKAGNVELVASEGDPERAIRTILALKPDIVFVDVEMPRLTGFDVIEQVRAQNFHPVFIFVTAYNQYAIKAIKATAFDFILKPVDLSELSETLRRYNGNGHSATSPITRHPKYETLTSREKEILKLVMEGLTSKEIAEKLFISKNTVDTHRRKVLGKMGVGNSFELLRE